MGKITIGRIFLSSIFQTTLVLVLVFWFFFFFFFCLVFFFAVISRLDQRSSPISNQRVVTPRELPRQRLSLRPSLVLLNASHRLRRVKDSPGSKVLSGDIILVLGIVQSQDSHLA
jgi:hypothetical protein